MIENLWCVIENMLFPQPIVYDREYNREPIIYDRKTENVLFPERMEYERELVLG